MTFPGHCIEPLTQVVRFLEGFQSKFCVHLLFPDACCMFCLPHPDNVKRRIQIVRNHLSTDEEQDCDLLDIPVGGSSNYHLNVKCQEDCFIFTYLLNLFIYMQLIKCIIRIYHILFSKYNFVLNMLFCL